MKNLFITILVAILLISCEDINIELNKHYIEVDYQAQEVILKTDKNIWMATYDVASSDTEFVDHYTENDISYSVGEWFVVIHEHTKPRQIIITLQENQTDKERKVAIHVTNGDGGSDSATIIQKAKPTE